MLGGVVFCQNSGARLRRTALSIDLGRIIDLDRYPIDRTETRAYGAMLDRVRCDLARDGCAVLAGFVRASAIATLVTEAERVSPFAHRSFNRTNAYFTEDDESLPCGHPVRRFYERSNAFVPADNFGPDSSLRAVYEWEPFAPFVRTVLEEEHFYRYADPLADVIINVVESGGGFPWHFDTNNYTITLAIQNGDEGGLFEYVPNLRTPEFENYDGVRAVLDGKRDNVRSLALKPGDLQIFKGRYSLHRVTPVRGYRSRYVGIFSFADVPDMIARVARTRQLYGRILPIRLEREAETRRDALKD